MRLRSSSSSSLNSSDFCLPRRSLTGLAGGSTVSFEFSLSSSCEFVFVGVLSTAGSIDCAFDSLFDGSVSGGEFDSFSSKSLRFSSSDFFRSGEFLYLSLVE